MDIVGKARRLEQRIARSLEAAVGEFAGTGAVASEPLEVIHRFLDRVELEIQHTGRGRRTFPYNRVRLLVPVPSKERQARARFDAVAAGPPSLRERVISRLESAGAMKAAPEVEIEYVARPGAAWETPQFRVEFFRDDAPAASPAPLAIPELKLTVLAGKASHRNYTFTGGRIDLGRRAEVLDTRQRLIRTNHVAFVEDGTDINASVSRRHAHVIYAAPEREYRIIDDRSAHGTGILRKGRTITVPSGPRGVRLQDGDEILLGRARIRVAIPSG